MRDASVGGNIARFINHACKPNCYSQVIGDVVWIRAGRNIAAGEELTYDYRTDGEADDSMPLPAGLPDDAVTPVAHVLYLHGFASSPASSKAQRFEQELAVHGVGFSCPDFNQPAFETLTVTRMLDGHAPGPRSRTRPACCGHRLQPGRVRRRARGRGGMGT